VSVASLAVIVFLAVNGIIWKTKSGENNNNVDQSQTASQVSKSQPAGNNNGQNVTADNSSSNVSLQAQPPKPTGNVDDTVNAIEQGASAEGTQATSDTNDAQAAANGASAASNLGSLGGAN